MDADPKELLEEEELINASKDQKEEEVRQGIIDKYGLNPDENPELIEQLTKDRIEEMKRFGKVVTQKRNWREKASKTAEPPKPPEHTSTLTPEQIAQKAREEALATLEARDLEELNLPDDLKSEVQRIAKIQNVSIRKAVQDPYILAKKEAYEKKQKEEEAAISRKNNSGAARTSFSVDSPPQLDMSTEEGRKKWADYKNWLKTQKL
jgi:hypothetical protein